VHKFAGQVTPNTYFKGTPLFDVEMSQKRYNDYYIPPTKSDTWPIELCHRQ